MSEWQGNQHSLSKVSPGAAALVTSDRKARYRQRKEKQGMVQFSAWIPAECLADFTIAAGDCRLNPDLTPAMYRNRKTGCFQKIGKR